MRSVWFILALGFMFSSSSAFVAQEERCPDTLPSRLVIGDAGQVSPGQPNNVRATPSRSGALVGQIPPGGAFSVQDGPQCADGFAWWQVDYDGLVGWTVEANRETYALNPAQWVEHEGVRFALDSAAFSMAVTPETRAANPPGEQTQDWLSYPEYIRFLFGDDPDAAKFRAELEIFPLAAFSQMNPRIADEILELRKLLDSRPGLTGSEPLPFVSIGVGAAQMIAVRAAYLDLPNVTGVRYLTAYAQDTIPFLRDTLSYAFEGITSDGAYYISFILPVSVSVLPEERDDDAFGSVRADDTGDLYRTYRNTVQGQVDSAPAEAFSPPLEALDALVASIRIEPGTLAEAVQVGGEQPEAFPVLVYGACPQETLPSRLTVGGGARVTLPFNTAICAVDAPGGEQAGWCADAGEALAVLDGPVCVENRDYWLTYSTQYGGRAGWIQEQGFLKVENRDTYYLAPAGDAPKPEILTGQTATDCAIIPIDYASLMADPNINADSFGALIPGATYYADALLRRPEGGFRWWRLSPGATIIVQGEGRNADRQLWVLAGEVSESNGCADVPTLAEP